MEGLIRERQVHRPGAPNGATQRRFPPSFHGSEKSYMGLPLKKERMLDSSALFGPSLILLHTRMRCFQRYRRSWPPGLVGVLLLVAGIPRCLGEPTGRPGGVPCFCSRHPAAAALGRLEAVVRSLWPWQDQALPRLRHSYEEEVCQVQDCTVLRSGLPGS